MPSLLQTECKSTRYGELLQAKDWRACRAMCFEGWASSGDTVERTRWFNNYVGCELLAGNLLTARDASDKSADLASHCPDTSIKGHYHNNRAAVLSALGLTDDAFIHYAVAADLYAESGREDLVAEVLNNTGCLHVQIGDTELALDYLERAAEKFRALEDWNHLAEVHDSLCQAYRARGQGSV